MSLEEEISEQLKQAMRSGDKQRLSVLRMLLSELKVAGTSGEELDEMSVVKSYAKKLRKGAEEYEELGQDEKADEVNQELEIVEEFLPEQMDRADVEALIDEIIAEKELSGPRDIGIVMKTVMGEYGEVVEGQIANEIAREKLQELD
ncbi:MAG: GatB/YqeY domain-containing protein [Candidatus Brocadiia bacterium]